MPSPFQLQPPRSPWKRLRARYDNRCLLPPPSAAGEPPPIDALEANVRRWCEQPQAWSVALLRQGAVPNAVLNTWQQRLDGSFVLAALGGGVAGWRYRLGLKLAEAMGAAADPQRPWDCGWLHPETDLARFARVWRARRHTLVVVPAQQSVAALHWFRTEAAPPSAVDCEGGWRLRWLLCLPGRPPLPPRLEQALETQPLVVAGAGLWLE